MRKSRGETYAVIATILATLSLSAFSCNKEDHADPKSADTAKLTATGWPAGELKMDPVTGANWLITCKTTAEPIPVQVITSDDGATYQLVVELGHEKHFGPGNSNLFKDRPIRHIGSIETRAGAVIELTTAFPQIAERCSLK